MKALKNILNKLYSEDNKVFAVLSTKRKIDLSLVDDIENEVDSFEEAESEASYLAYEYGDEVIDAYDEFRMKYDLDNYVVNGSIRYLEESAEILKASLNKLEIAADELGIPPSEVYYDYDNLKQRVDNAQSLSDEAKSKYREVTDYTGMPNFWN
tara:strand:+ start:1153 stop:1614 length:462 start_codon:yes stop_codon:yes gene_type:complete